ncbi:arsenate reductase family protein [Cochlodiniinecator piscidefendens]|uniref:arsenate reductase family protein n=1 Tax=Cochlodiniinecator piscidefendens TaxID=2715756 RepID=UPI001408595E|nr:ArsC/Spx/MgsR family protein [Cochlodiniinecator piscidefendens]
MKFYGLKTCDTCRKALKALRLASYDVDVVDVRADGVTQQDLQRFWTAFDIALINKKSTTWRGLTEEQRGQDPVELLLENPTLMKRPVIEDGDRLTLGWGKDVAASWVGE